MKTALRCVAVLVCAMQKKALPPAAKREALPLRRPPDFDLAAVALRQSRWCSMALLVWLPCVHPGIALGQDATSPAPIAIPSAAISSDVLPLSKRIDTRFASVPPLLQAASAADGELLRRLSLDLRGVVPTRPELDAFAADQSSERWPTWVRRFLSDPLCDEHLVGFLDRTLMLRRAHTRVDRASWLNFLREQVADDTPLDEFSRQLLDIPWWEREQRPAQRFFLDRAGDPNLIARDLGRIFLGQDLQCAQCHDHPNIDDYKQYDYHGLLAFFASSKLTEVVFKDAEGKDQTAGLYVELPAGDAAFESVFNKGVPYRSGPRLPGQTEQFEEYRLPDARLLRQAPAEALAGAPVPPQHSRRKLLAEQLTARSNREFVSNWANRLWAMVFGQGLLHPVDMRHADNPPEDVELFEAITDGLLEADLRPRRFLEQLVLSEAYRRGNWTRLQTSLHRAVPHNVSQQQADELRQFSLARQQQLQAQLIVVTDSDHSAEEDYDAAISAWEDVQASRAEVRTELDAVETAMSSEHKKSLDANAALLAAQKQQSDTRTQIGLLEDAAAKLQESANLAGGDDAELKQAIAVAKQRAETAHGLIPALDQAVVDAQANTTATAAQLEQATVKVQAVVDKLLPIQQTLAEADQTMLTMRLRWNQTHLSLLNINRDLERQARRLAWLDSLVEIERTQQATELAIAASAANENEATQARQQLQAAQEQLTAFDKTKQVAVQELANARQKLADHKTHIDQLQSAIDGLVAASQLVNNADALQSAQETLMSEVETRRSQSGQPQADLARAQAVLADAETQLAEQRSLHERLQLMEQRKAESCVAAQATVIQKQSELAAAQNSSAEKWTAIQEDLTNQVAISRTTPLTPEQLCWSILRITGQLDFYIQAELAELEKQTPLPANADEVTKAVRQRQAVRGAYDKLRGYADTFVSLYASGPDKTQDDFFASADQALYTANSGSVFAWAGPGGNNPTQQAIAAADDHQVAHILYWNVFCRQPSSAEDQLICETLAAAGDDRNAVIQEMVWGMLASAEFRFCQ